MLSQNGISANTAKILAEAPLAGVRYNVVRRPAHKTVESALKKLNDDRKANRVGEWFARFNVEVSEADLLRFRRTCLDPLLENLLDDYEWWGHAFVNRNLRGAVTTVKLPTEDLQYDYDVRARYWPQHRLRHFRTPYHYDPIGEGGSGDVDDYLDTGNMAGLRKLTTLFPELEGLAGADNVRPGDGPTDESGGGA